MERKYQGAKVPPIELSLPGAKIRGNESSIIRSKVSETPRSDLGQKCLRSQVSGNLLTQWLADRLVAYWGNWNFRSQKQILGLRSLWSRHLILGLQIGHYIDRNLTKLIFWLLDRMLIPIVLIITVYYLLCCVCLFIAIHCLCYLYKIKLF